MLKEELLNPIQLCDSQLHHLCVFKVVNLKEQLETTVQKLNECKDVLKTNENGKDVLQLASYVYIFYLFSA